MGKYKLQIYKIDENKFIGYVINFTFRGDELWTVSSSHDRAELYSKKEVNKLIVGILKWENYKIKLLHE